MSHVYYLIREDVRAERNRAGLDYTPLYIPCLLAWMGISGEPIEAEAISSLTDDDVLLVGCEELDLALIAPGTGPGTVVLFGNGGMPPRSPGIKAFVTLWEEEIPLFVPLCGTRYSALSPGKILAWGRNTDEEGPVLPAIVRYDNLLDFRFDLPGTVWFAGDGFSDGEGKNGFFIGRTPDTRPLPPDMPMPYPYNDHLLFLLEDFLLSRGVLMFDRLPPAEDGGVPDFALHVSGDDDFTSAAFNLQAAARMSALGLPYHINAMPGGERFIINREQAKELRDLGCELALHTDFTVQPYTPEGQAASCDLFARWFGFRTRTGTNHCFIQAGMAAERLRWLGNCGIDADNGKLGEVDPADINAFNITGFSFGTSFPRYTLDDAEHGNVPLHTIEIPINYYEPRLGDGYNEPARIESYVDRAAADGRIAQFFCHPHYLSDENPHTPLTLAALRLALNHADACGYKLLKTTTDRIASFWQARSKAKITPLTASEPGETAVCTDTDVPLLLRLPAPHSTQRLKVLLDGTEVPVVTKKRSTGLKFYVHIPEGEHRFVLISSEL